MSIYIRGMKMPKDGECIVISSYGTAYKYNPCDVVMYGDAYNENKDAIELPPHGRLIDADALLTHRFNGVVGKTEKSSYMVGWNAAIEAVVENADTIIPADPGWRRGRMTNVDRMRKMSDEELATEIAWLIVEAMKQLHPFAKWKIENSELIAGTAEEMLDWLKQEVQENG